ncbi:MAG: hypothetical protein LDL33_06750 [Desulfomonile sp.]|nr:hypothetical protein [Desulfomonile sp.]
MKRTFLALTLCLLPAISAPAADWYILCVKVKVPEGSACVKCSEIFRVFSEVRPSGGCTAIGMRPLVFPTRQEALEWKKTNCTCP